MCRLHVNLSYDKLAKIKDKLKNVPTGKYTNY